MSSKTKKNITGSIVSTPGSILTQQVLNNLENVPQKPEVKKAAVKKPTAKVKSGNKLEDYVNFLRALASPERLNILEALEKHEMCTSDIEQKFYMEQSTASHHLTTLLKAQIVTSHKDGRRVFYRVNEDFLNKYYKKFIRTLENVPKFKGKVDYKTR
jgi:ArsR family transcriptional regulator, lead/cadmium/zinc/bismuth-responsive transcriptional repressor